LRFLQSGGVDGVVHVFDGLLDLELLGVKLVFELIDGGFEFGDRLDKELNRSYKMIKSIYLFGVVSSLAGILELFFERSDFLDVLSFFGGVFLGGGFKRFEVVSNGLKKV
jgi:hypothetical protein